MIDLAETMQLGRGEVLDEAEQRLRHAHLQHYEASGSVESGRRLDQLFSMVLDSVTQRSLTGICRYAERVARERFEAGFDITEVQTAFNILEEALWQVVISRIDPSNLAEAAGMIDTALGAAKDTLARTWVSLASKTHVISLDLTALFEGAAS